jgi:putative nucleotidyltransferase with HDIG domain
MGLGNYTISYANGSLTVNPRPLTITANDASKTYGGSVTFAGTAFTVIGLVNADTVTSVTLTSAGATASIAVGTYSIVPSAAVGMGLGNYTISYANGSLTVNPRPLTITANDASKTYGEAVAFAGIEFTTSGLVNYDTITSVILTSAGAAANAAVGTYSIVAIGTTGTGFGNYAITYVNGSLTVNKVSVGLSLSSSVSTSTKGKTITFTATVNGTGATGTVTFRDGETTLGSSTLSDGTATYTTPMLSVGSHSVTAVYDGDANFTGGTSSVVDLRVKAAAGFSWALIGGLIAAAVLIGLFFLLLILRRRRKHPSNANIVNRGTQVSVGAAGKRLADADSNLPNPVSPGPLTAGEALTSGTPPPAVENSRAYSIQVQRELAASLEKVKKDAQAAIQAICLTEKIRSPYIASHEKRVSLLACAIAKEMGLTARQIEGIRVAGLLHDIGKITVPTEILSKTGELSPAEISLIKDHPKVAFDMLKDIEFEWPIAQIVVQHHERLDGSGYPYGISGRDILLEARILGVADVVVAMSSNRPYRAALGIEEALTELALGYGTLYDSAVVSACKKVFNQRGFKVELSSSPS